MNEIHGNFTVCLIIYKILLKIIFNTDPLKKLKNEWSKSSIHLNFKDQNAKSSLNLFILQI